MQRYWIKVGQERCLGPAQRARTQQAMDVAVMHGPTDEAGMELRLAVTNFRLHHKRRGSHLISTAPGPYIVSLTVSPDGSRRSAPDPLWLHRAIAMFWAGATDRGTLDEPTEWLRRGSAGFPLHHVAEQPLIRRWRQHRTNTTLSARGRARSVAVIDELILRIETTLQLVMRFAPTGHDLHSGVARVKHHIHFGGDRSAAVIHRMRVQRLP